MLIDQVCVQMDVATLNLMQFLGNMDPAKFRVPTTKSLDDCLRFWNTADESRGLLVPLRDWPTLFKPSQYRTEAVKWGRIRRVVREFEEHCGGDRDEFEECFPALADSYTKLWKAVDKAREEREELVRRHHK